MLFQLEDMIEATVHNSGECHKGVIVNRICALIPEFPCKRAGRVKKHQLNASKLETTGVKFSIKPSEKVASMNVREELTEDERSQACPKRQRAGFRCLMMLV